MKLNGAVNDLTKVVAEKDAEILKLNDELAKIKAEPVAPKGAVRIVAVGKAEDAGVSAISRSERIEKAAAECKPTDATSMIRECLQNPNMVRPIGGTKEAQ